MIDAGKMRGTRRRLSYLFGLGALLVSAGELLLCFVGPLAFVQKPSLILFPLYAYGLTKDETDAVTEFAERQLALTRSYDIVSHRFIVEYYVRTDPDFDRTKILSVDQATARKIARELEMKRFALGWVFSSSRQCELTLAVWDLSDGPALRRASFVAKDLKGLLSGIDGEGKPFDFRERLGIPAAGIGPADFLVLVVFLLQALVGARALGGKRPGLLVEIVWAAMSVLFLFDYIHALSANMDYMQRFIATTGRLRLAEDTTTERIYALLRYLPSLLLLGAHWIFLPHAGKAAEEQLTTAGSGAPIGRAARLRLLISRRPLPWVVLSALLFALAFPSPLSLDGITPLAWIALVPLFLVIMTSTPKMALLCGVYFGLLQGLFVNYWLGTYGYVTLRLISIAVAAEYLLFMIKLVWLLRVSGRWGFLVAPTAWLLFDWLRSSGMLGYPWGLIGATQYRFLSLIQISSLTGIWGVDFVVLFVNAAISWAVCGPLVGFRWSLRRPGRPGRHLLGPVFDRGLPLVGAAALLLASLSVGGSILAELRSKLSAARERSWMSALLLQPSCDPRKTEYSDLFDRLTSLTDSAIGRLRAVPDLVAWPEGAFMLDIGYWTDPSRTDSYWGALVRRFLDYQRGLGTWLLTGTQDHGTVEEDGKVVAKNFNSSILFDPYGRRVAVYHKIHLVPFTEHFPLSKQRFAALYGLFKKYDISDWGTGDRHVVFDHPIAPFATPICFEDVFSDGVRRYVLAGARLIVNMSNDYWSLSPVEGRQHGLFALFRAVENQRPLLRTTASGFTVAVDPTGRVLPGSPAAYTPSALFVRFPVAELPLTLYTRWGDWFPAAAGLSLLAATAALFLRRLTAFVRRRRAAARAAGLAPWSNELISWLRNRKNHDSSDACKRNNGASMSKTELHILGLAGSLRAGSANKGLLREATGLAPAGMSIEIVDLADIPLYNEDVRIAGPPDSVGSLKAKIAAADGLLFAVTEYNYSISGVLKNAIDWVSRPPDTSPLARKPIALLGAGGGLGTARAQYHMRQVAVFTDMLPMNKPELMVARAWERFDAEGNLLDETVRPQLSAFLAAFADWIELVRTKTTVS